MRIMGWHGGHRWDGSPEIRAPRQGRYEHGCGIYLTNIWQRAYGYAKGGGSVFRMTLEVEKPEPQAVSHDEVLAFIRDCPGLRRRKQIADYIQEHPREVFRPEYLSNLCVNEKALTATSAPILARWLTEKGLPLTTTSQGTTNGTREEWMVVFDPAIIKRAEVVRAAELDRLPSYGDRDFPTFSEQFEAVLDAEPAAPRM